MAKLVSKPIKSTYITPIEDEIEISPEVVIEYVDRIIEIPVEVIKEVPIEVIRYVQVIQEVEKIVNVPEYITVREIETVEIPVEITKEIERIVTVHDIEQTLAEKRKVDALKKSIKNLKIMTMILMLASFGIGVICGR